MMATKCKNPRVDEIDEPVVGKFYIVPCVYRISDFMHGWKPVIGPLHEDAEYIGVPGKHWHYDWRFIDRLPNPDESTNFGNACFLVGKDGAEISRPSVELHWRKCFRKMIEYKTTYVKDVDAYHLDSDLRTLIPWLGGLEKAYVDAKMNTESMLCPHRGIPLKGQPIRYGCVTCCGHGLRWNVQTGAMAPRVLAAEGTEMTNKNCECAEPKYSVDDRGNVAQFYDKFGEIVATLDREATVDRKPDQSTWNGGENVTRWAVANGYPQVKSLPRPE